MKSGDDGRMSPPTSTVCPARPSTSTNAAPTASTMRASMVSPTIPRTSYALKDADRSVRGAVLVESGAAFTLLVTGLILLGGADTGAGS